MFLFAQRAFTKMNTQIPREHFLMGRGRHRQNKFEQVDDGIYRCSRPSRALLGFASEIHRRNIAYVAPGDWRKTSVPFKDFENAASDICEIMRAVDPDVVIPTEADFEEHRAFAEVNMAVGVVGETTFSEFSVHRDNDNGFNVATLIIYLVCTAEGGGLNLYDPMGHGGPIKTIAARNDRGGPVAVAMRGDVPHCPAPIVGAGVRIAVVFQFPVRRGEARAS